MTYCTFYKSHLFLPLFCVYCRLWTWLKIVIKGGVCVCTGIRPSKSFLEGNVRQGAEECTLPFHLCVKRAGEVVQRHMEMLVVARCELTRLEPLCDHINQTDVNSRCKQPQSSVIIIRYSLRWSPGFSASKRKKTKHKNILVTPCVQQSNSYVVLLWTDWDHVLKEMKDMIILVLIPSLCMKSIKVVFNLPTKLEKIMLL